MRIVLLSGMDLCGKTTIAKCISERNSNVVIRKKFLTTFDPLKEIRNNRYKNHMPMNDWAAWWVKAVEDDLNYYHAEINKEHEYTYSIHIQDSLSAFKHYAIIKSHANHIEYPNIIRLENKLKCYPEMISIYLTTDYQERKRRYRLREVRGEISHTDKLILSRSVFEQIEQEYSQIICKCFPKTVFIDTTQASIEDIATKIHIY